MRFYSTGIHSVPYYKRDPQGKVHKFFRTTEVYVERKYIKGKYLPHICKAKGNR